MPFLKDQVAVVTGGSRGIGRAIVLMLAQQGCHVAFNYLQRDNKAKELQAEVEGLGVRCLVQKVNVRNYKDVKEWIDQIKNEFGRLDIVINNAGIIKDKALMLMSEEDWSDVIDTNLNGMFHVARAAIVPLLKEKRGLIINISSVSGLIGLSRQTNYSASKGGMNAFTKALAKEVAAYGLRVNAVAPGFIETDMLSGFPEAAMETILDMIPLGNMGKVQDVANCVKFLCSDAAQYITGQIIQVDGGLAIR